MHPVLKQISDIGIVPVIAIDDAEKAVPLAKALVAGGLPVAEITFRTAAGEAAIRAISREVPEMLVGAGTVRWTPVPGSSSVPASTPTRCATVCPRARSWSPAPPLPARWSRLWRWVWR